MAACGGGGSSASSPPTTVPPDNPVAEGPAGKPAELANVCTPAGEKSWIRANLDDVYLWYSDIVNVPSVTYSTPSAYFDALLVKSKDRFSFTASKSEIDDFFQSGLDIGYGADLVNENGKLRVTYVQPGSPADQQKIARGAQIIGINGSPITTLSSTVQRAALYPTATGATNSFEVLDKAAGSSRVVQMTAVSVNKSPVLQDTVITTPDNRKIGYLLFTDHVATAEIPLVLAFQKFKTAGIDDLVLDVRYNGGGYLYIADELASMIGGAKVQNQLFEQLRFNDKHPEKTNDPNYKMNFVNLSRQFLSLPLLNLPRVFVLTTARSCSATESVINGLSPFMQVITIGGATCGKPYGFIQQDNCDTSYFAIQFDGVNSAGQGGYVNGIAPKCSAADDLEHALGDSSERLLSTAIGYSKTASCPASGFSVSELAQRSATPAPESERYPWRNNRIVK
ncbi:S41 family peptidase [Undibacterium terreum]|uniref:Peptidase S41 n=1 Tax=Undibacterium terreum TaxID=1224302 RepID=A0A916XMQ4_9BURK|nr:S41 family peptidase [Undibacterium terreum]GGC83187.1 peptidase S41 [Undibacterium terreum]